MRGTNGQIRAQDTIAPGNDPREATRIASAEGPRRQEAWSAYRWRSTLRALSRMSAIDSPPESRCHCSIAALPRHW